MITDEVIKEIYRKNKKPPKDLNNLNLPEVLYTLKKHHNITLDNEDLTKAEIILNDIEEFNPFRRFLVRSLNAVLDFDKNIAFVFRNHILFLSKNDNQLRIHFRPEDEYEEREDDEESSFFTRLFRRKKK